MNRLAPLTGVAGIASVVAGLATDTAPTSSWSDSDIEKWFTTHSLGQWFLSAYLLAIGAALLLVFAAVVRDRLRRSGAGEFACSLISGSGILFASTILTGAGLYAAVPAGMTFADAPAPPAAVARYLLGAAYGVMVMFSALAAAVFALTVSVAALRNPALPRSLAIAGLPLSVLMLANAVLPMAAITLWFVAVSIIMTLRQNATPRHTTTPSPPLSAPTMATRTG